MKEISCFFFPLKISSTANRQIYHKLIPKCIEHWNSEIYLILFHLFSIWYAVCCLCIYECVCIRIEKLFIYLYCILLKLIRNLWFEICDLCDMHCANDVDGIYRLLDSRLLEKKRVFCLKMWLFFHQFFILRFHSVFQFFYRHFLVYFVFCVGCSHKLQWKLLRYRWCSSQFSFEIIC